MINLATENILSLSDAARALPKVDGKQPHISSLWRWTKHGVRGVRLEHARIGNRIVTSAEALNRFANNLAAAEQQPQHTTAASAKRQLAGERIET